MTDRAENRPVDADAKYTPRKFHWSRILSAISAVCGTVFLFQAVDHLVLDLTTSGCGFALIGVLLLLSAIRWRVGDVAGALCWLVLVFLAANAVAMLLPVEAAPHR